jgi:hypothetical protein
MELFCPELNRINGNQSESAVGAGSIFIPARNKKEIYTAAPHNIAGLVRKKRGVDPIALKRQPFFFAFF